MRGVLLFSKSEKYMVFDITVASQRLLSFSLTLVFEIESKSHNHSIYFYSIFVHLFLTVCNAKA